MKKKPTGSHSLYVVGEPQAYETTAAAPAPRRIERVGVLIVHGMGQQIEFETLDLLERGLRGRLDPASAEATSPTTSRFVRLGPQRSRRLELSVTTPAGSRRDVHLYEAYWAPMTEGRVSLRDVSRLLWRASTVKKRPFSLWLFGKMHREEPDRATVWYVNVAYLIVTSFLLLTTVLSVGFGMALLGGSASSWISDALMVDLIWPMLAVVASAALAGLAVAAARLLKKRRAGISRGWIKRVLRMSVLSTLALLALAGGVGALWSLVVFLGHRGYGGHPILPDLFAGQGPTMRFLLSGLAWCAFLWAGFKLREILVQYLGDVAAYVTPNALDRFADLRKEIKDFVFSIADALYKAAEKDGQWLYDRVVIAGHSLGSVVAYDALNRLINEDSLTGNRGLVVARTSLFLTFGSPLDKTAYIFARQGERTADPREVLVAAVQPLLQSYENRKFRWVNLFSGLDPISSPLRLYDDPSVSTPGAVENEEDPDAVGLFLAHVDYWQNPKLFEILHGALIQ